MSKDRVLTEFKPRLFTPTVVRGIKNSGERTKETTLFEIADSNIESTSSFRYSAPGEGVRSTQQLNVDWSKFENHTFFNSAVSKVNVAFDKIVNEFPFDGSNREVEMYLDSLTGYENYVLQQFPKNVGYLNFSGSGPSVDPSNGTYIKVRDQAGSLYPQFSNLSTGEKVLDPGTDSFSIEMQLLSAAVTNNPQVICQRLQSNSYGFGLFLTASARTDNVDLIFSVVSGSTSLIASGTIQKGSFEHICAVYDRTEGVNKLKLYVNESQVGESDGEAETGKLGFTPATLFTIGSGSIQHLSGTDGETASDWKFTPTETFSGSIDEFRFFHSARTVEDQKEYATKTIYASDDLKLYFKFNEPSGSTGINDVVLDSSGKSLHSRISNYYTTKNDIALRSTSSFYGSEIKSPMVYENTELSPVLFPKFAKVTSLNRALLHSASSYDNVNPNMITKLIPSHYLEEGQYFQGFRSIDGDIANDYSGSSLPGSGELGMAQLLSAMLFVYAKQFDEIKLMIDEVSNLVHVDYDGNDSVSDPFLLFAGKYMGVQLPKIFSNASLQQQVSGENLTIDNSRAGGSLNYVQNQVWRRILTNMGEITRSRGTIHSVKSLIRAMGVEPDGLLRIREYGGPSRKTLRNLRVKKAEVSTMIDFSGSFKSIGDWSIDIPNYTLNDQGFPTGSHKVPRIMSPYLSASRFEIGYPKAQGTMILKHPEYTSRPSEPKSGSLFSHSVHGISNQKNDGLFTSGSWTYEGIYQIPSLVTGSHFLTQSLARLQVTGSTTGAKNHGLVFNLVSYSGSNRLELFGRPGLQTSLVTDPEMRLVLTGPDIYDGNLWNVCFGRYRSDDPTSGSGHNLTSSFFLRCSRQSYGEIKEYFTTSSLFQASSVNGASSTGGAQQVIDASKNAHGMFVVIGSQSIDTAGSLYLNSKTLLPEATYGAARSTNFSGRVGHIRFWSKGLTETEFKEHTRNFKSLGVDNPKVNFNFDRISTGSFERLRLDVTSDQPVTNSNSLGDIDLIDFSQQFVFGKTTRPWEFVEKYGGERGDERRYFNMSGSGFEINKQVSSPHTFYYSYLSPRFDMLESDQKVRVRSYISDDKIEDSDYAYKAPMYEIPRDDIPRDDTRFSVDFSVVQALNEDIMTIFSSLDFFDNALGDPNLMFDEYYPDLDQLRKIYFNRLVDKINIKQFFEFFKWFDSTMGLMIEQLIPKKTSFNGVQFVVESHVLEHHRMRYLSDEIYLKISEREPSFYDLLSKSTELME